MHDVIRDFALDIASKGKHAFLVTSGDKWTEWTGKTAISLWSDDIKKFPDALECPKLQILMLICSYPDLQLDDNFFVGMRNLVVLFMRSMKFGRLPQSFSCLENLRTLRLSECELGDISAIGKLKNLISLSFRHSNIKVLPKEVGELINLKLLDLSGCKRLEVIAAGVIQNLSQLEVLYMGIKFWWGDSQRNASLSELIHLSRLMMLEIWIADASMLPDEVLFENLTKFKVSIGDDDEYFHFENDVLSKLLKLSRLSENVVSKAGIKMLLKRAQSLELDDISGMSVALPSHLGGYESLKELIVGGCKDVNYVLDINESEYEPQTPSLQQLHLFNLPLLKEICRGKIPSLFVTKLECLSLYKLPSLVHLWQFPAESVALTNLTTMNVDSCEKLKYVFEHCSAKSFLTLKELAVEKCTNLQTIYLSTEEEQDDVIVFPKLRHLRLSLLQNLASFGSKRSSESILFSKQVIFLALETLHICDLEKLEKIWHIHTPVESFFQLKVLELTLCPQLLVVFPPQSTLNLRNLEEICIENCDSVEILFQLDDFPLAVGDEMILFPRLVTLKLVKLPKLTAFLRTTSQKTFQATVHFPILKSIYVKGLNSIKNIWHDKVSAKCFGQLQQLHVSKCDQLVEVFPCCLLPNLHCLKQVTVEKCNLLEKLFQLDSCPVSETKTMTILKQLKSLNLDELPELRQIWWTDDKRPCGVKVSLGELTHLKIKNCKRLVKIFPSNLIVGLQNLTMLHVESCESLEQIFAIEDHPPILSNLQRLKLHNLPNLKQLWWNEKTCESFGLPNLLYLMIDTCPALQFIFDPSIANRLDNLRILIIRNCSSIIEIAPEKRGEKIVFPFLYTLHLEELPCFTRFPAERQSVEFPDAKKVKIVNCLNMPKSMKF